jgi:hypothetical protein
LPDKLGVFPIPGRLAARVRFWVDVFGRHTAEHVIVYVPKMQLILATPRATGGGLLPNERGPIRSVRYRRRRVAGMKSIRELKTHLRVIARLELKAERAEKKHWRKQRRKCRQIRRRRDRSVCFRLLKFRPALIRIKEFQKSFASLEGGAQKLYKRLKEIPQAKNARWYRFFRTLAKVRFSFHSSYRGYLERGRRVELQFRPYVQKALKDAKLPVQLSALPFVESMYNPWVESKVAALGLWQLMPNTGKELGLYVPLSRFNGGFYPPFDERLDPVMATRGASRFLRICRHYFKTSWPLAVTSYNQGPGRMRGESRKLKTKKLSDIIRRSRNRTFGYDGRNFYAKFLAAALLMFTPLQKKLNAARAMKPAGDIKALQFHRRLYPHPIWWKDLQKATGLSAKVLLLFNPSLLPMKYVRYHPVPAFFPLRLPKALTAAQLKQVDEMGMKGTSRLVVVSRRRDNFRRISRRYGVSIRGLMKENKEFATWTPKLRGRPCKQRYRLPLNAKPWMKRRWSRRVKRCERRYRPRKRRPWHRLPAGKEIRIPTFRRANVTARTRKIRPKFNTPIGWLACVSCTTVWHLRTLNPDLKVGRLNGRQKVKVPICSRWRRRLFRNCQQFRYLSKKRYRRLRRKRRKRRRRRRKSAALQNLCAPYSPAGTSPAFSCRLPS